MNYIRLIRQRRGITQTQLAERSGISQHSISKLETGRTQPKPETLEKLASALGVDSPGVLTDDLGSNGVIAFSEILEATPEQRLDHFGLIQELGELEEYEARLRKRYAERVERSKDRPEDTEHALEWALLTGYVMGLREGRQYKGGDGET